MFITLSDPHKRGNCFTSCWPFRIQLVRTSCGCLFGEEVVTECFGGICEWCLWILGRGLLWLARLLLAHCWFFGCSFLWFAPLSWRRVFRCCFESYQCYALKDDHWFFQFFPDCYLTSYSNIAPSPSILTWPPASTPPAHPTPRTPPGSPRDPGSHTAAMNCLCTWGNSRTCPSHYSVWRLSSDYLTPRIFE